MFDNLHSIGLGLLDRYAGVKLKLAPQRKKLFSEGAGEGRYKSLRDLVVSQGADGFQDIEMDLVSEVTDSDIQQEGIKVMKGTFLSPAAEWFQDEHVKFGVVDVVVPENIEEPKGVAVLFPMAGDLGVSFRRRNIAVPLAKQGYASIILHVSYAKGRMPSGQTPILRTCDEYGVYSWATIVEGAKLVKWARSYFDGTPIAVSGVSLGGVFACSVATLDKQDLSIATLVSGNGPQFLQGIFKNAVSTAKLSASEFASFLRELSVTSLVQDSLNRGQDYEERVLVMNQVFAKHDAAILKQSTEEVERAFHKICRSHTLTPKSGGHFSSISNASTLLVPELIQAFQKYEEVKQMTKL